MFKGKLVDKLAIALRMGQLLAQLKYSIIPCRISSHLIWHKTQKKWQNNCSGDNNATKVATKVFSWNEIIGWNKRTLLYLYTQKSADKYVCKSKKNKPENGLLTFVFYPLLSFEIFSLHTAANSVKSFCLVHSQLN